MSGFTASNSRIRITETVGTTEKEAFDTNNDMPHIVGTATETVEVTFSGMPAKYVYSSYSPCGYLAFEQVCAYEYVCTDTYECTYTPGTFSCGYSCGWSYSGGYSCDFVCETGPSSYDCGYVTSCGWENVCEWDFVCYPETYYSNRYNASDYSNTQNICNLPTDEDGNVIDIDFVVVQATGSRTTAGTDRRISNPFLTTVPSDTFSFQGSMLLESSLQDNGDSWMKRIMSVLIDNTSGKLKLKSQHSNAQRHTGQIGSSSSNAANDAGTKSVFSFTFKIFFGRFK